MRRFPLLSQADTIRRGKENLVLELKPPVMRWFLGPPAHPLLLFKMGPIEGVGSGRDRRQTLKGRARSIFDEDVRFAGPWQLSVMEQPLPEGMPVRQFQTLLPETRERRDR